MALTNETVAQFTQSLGSTIANTFTPAGTPSVVYGCITSGSNAIVDTYTYGDTPEAMTLVDEADQFGKSVRWYREGSPPSGEQDFALVMTGGFETFELRAFSYEGSDTTTPESATLSEVYDGVDTITEPIASATGEKVLAGFCGAGNTNVAFTEVGQTVVGTIIEDNGNGGCSAVSKSDGAATVDVGIEGDDANFLAFAAVSVKVAAGGGDTVEGTAASVAEEANAIPAAQKFIATTSASPAEDASAIPAAQKITSTTSASSAEDVSAIVAAIKVAQTAVAFVADEGNAVVAAQKIAQTAPSSSAESAQFSGAAQKIAATTGGAPAAEAGAQPTAQKVLATTAAAIAEDATSSTASIQTAQAPAEAIAEDASFAANGSKVAQASSRVSADEAGFTCTARKVTTTTVAVVADDATITAFISTVRATSAAMQAEDARISAEAEVATEAFEFSGRVRIAQLYTGRVRLSSQYTGRVRV